MRTKHINKLLICIKTDKQMTFDIYLDKNAPAINKTSTK